MQSRRRQAMNEAKAESVAETRATVDAAGAEAVGVQGATGKAEEAKRTADEAKRSFEDADREADDLADDDE
jgi:hypothetical protein